MCVSTLCATARAQAKITSLRVYPVKSCAGHKVQQATLGDRGLDMDRLWMVIDGVGRFMSQRRCAKMALISPSLPRTKHEVSLDGAAPHKDCTQGINRRTNLHLVVSRESATLRRRNRLHSLCTMLPPMIACVYPRSAATGSNPTDNTAL